MNGIFEEILIIIFLILLNGFFSGSEAALLAVRPSRVKELVKRGRPAARIVEQFKKRPEVFLSTVQVGVTLVGTLASVVSGARVVTFLIPQIRKIPWPPVQQAAEPLAIGLVVLMVSFLSLIIGELVPKYIALARPGKVVMHTARPIQIFSRLTYPVICLLTYVSSALARLAGVRRGDTAGGITDEELKLMALEGSRVGNIDHTEKRLVHAALGFTHIVGRNVMTPRTEMSALDIQWEPAKILRTLVEEGYSRYPVYRGDLDEIVGILYTKDVIKRLSVNKDFEFDDLLRKPYFVPDSMPIGELLAKFQATHTHIAVVLDQFGGTAGIITLEDILEELVGEIRDEHDDEVRDFIRRGDHHAIAAGDVTVEDFNDYFEAELPTDGAGTINGLLAEKLGRIPRMNEEVTFGPITLRVLRADSRRVLSVEARRLVVEEKED